MPRLNILFLMAAVLPAAAAEKPFAFGSVRFEENRGQADDRVRFLTRARGQQVFLTDNGAVFSPPQGPAVAMQFAGAGKCRWMPDGSASTSISYYLGNDPSKWVRMAPVFDRVVWHDAWPGVDIAFHGNGERLEYDLVLKPHADPSRIRIRFDRPARPRVTGDGSVEIVSEGNIIRQHVPEIWQETAAGGRSRIDGRFVADGRNGLRLALSGYERSKAVVVDPVLDMATYVGGENEDEIVAVADGVVAGNTRSIAFPGAALALRSSRDIFIRGTGSANPNNRNVYYGTTVIGGSGDDQLAGVAVITIPYFGFYVAGTTTSTDFPAAYDSTLKYNGGASDGFVAFISVSGNYTATLTYSSYVGGSGEDRITSFAGNGMIIALAGVTDSPDLPTTGAPQQSLAGGKDAFYGILSPIYAGTTVYGYLGGSGDDAAFAVAIRHSGSVWIGGQTRSPDFPFAAGSLSGPSDAFLAEISTPFAFTARNAPVAVKAWRIGGNGDDRILALTSVLLTTQSTNINGSVLATPFSVDGIGFAGSTTSTDLPVLNAAQPQPGGDRDGFVGIWDRTNATPRWLTYLGGSGPDEAAAIAQTWAGDLYVGGSTASRDLPVVNALQPALAGGQDGIFAAYDYSGALQHLTYFGGSGDDRVQGIAVLSNFDARIVGSTTSADLPQKQPSQDYGGATDGFMADIGSDYFLGPTSLVLAKDGSLPFSIRPARSAFRPSVTYQSSDPSRVRFSYLGRSFDQVTAAPEDTIAVQGLADNGQVDILITSPGFTTKTIHVNLYPGAFVSPLNTSAPISTWSPNIPLYASYCPIDPATGAVAGFCMGLRNGMPQPGIHWVVSDPTVLQIVDNGGGYIQLQPLQPGTATLTLSVDGYTVLQSTQTVTVAAPRPVAPANDFHIGKDLSVNLPINFTLNGAYVYSGYQGTLTARSGDPSRLLLSLDAGQPGVAQVSVTMSSRSGPVIWAQALAGDGTVPVFLSLSGVEGEVPMNVVLEPSMLRWGLTQYVPSVGNQFSPSISLTTFSQGTPLVLAFQGVSGSPGQLRPGAPPPTLTMSNSDPRVVELNRLTLTMGDNTKYTVRGVAPGSSTLTLTSSDPAIQPVPDTVSVTVQAFAPALPAFPSSFYVGNGLQTPVTFRYDPTAAASVTVSVDDISVALVSSSQSTRGADRFALPVGTTGLDQYTFYLQGQGSSGRTTVHVLFPEGERTFTVSLLPSGAGFYSLSAATVQGYNGGAQVGAYALDRDTGIGVFQQSPQPGPGISVHFSADAPVQLSSSSAVLTSDASGVNVDYTLPPAGQRATIRVTTDANSSVSPLTSTRQVGTVVSSDPVTLGNIAVPRGGIAQFSLRAVTLPATVTSSDPQNVLVSANATDAGSASVQLPKGASNLFIHGLGDSGSYALRVDSPDAASSTIQVGLQLLQFTIYPYGTVPLGGMTAYSANLNASTLRPGIGPLHFTAQTADPSIATVTPAAFDVGTGATFAGKLILTGVSPGTTQLTVTGPPDVYVIPPVTTVSVPAVPPAQVLPSYTLGVNLQGSAQIDLGANFDNPNGVIVTLTSANPDVLLLSRSATTTGTASVVLAVPAGARSTQAVYLQAVAQGSATIQVTVNGSTQAAATAAITASWVNCGSLPISLNAGAAQTFSCYARYNAPQPSAPLQDVGPRAGLTDLTLNLSSSASDIFTVTPASVTLAASAPTVTLRGVAPGTGVLKLAPPAAFGPSPDGSETVMVTVTQPPLTTACSGEIALGMDTQQTCTISAAAGSTVTATSSDPTLLLVSADAKTAGGPSASIAANSEGVAFTFQSLAAYGTVEVVISAPGYRDLRIAIALRSSEINLAIQGYPSSPPLVLRVGGSATLAVSMRVGGYPATLRAGASLAVDLATDQSGIVSLSPAHLLISSPQSTGNVQVNAVAAGSTIIRLAVPSGYLATGTPLPVSVASQ